MVYGTCCICLKFVTLKYCCGVEHNWCGLGNSKAAAHVAVSLQCQWRSQTFADAREKGGQATYPCSTHTHAHHHMNINILFKICFIYSVCKIAILSSVKINFNYSYALCLDVRATQTDTGFSCTLIPDQSHTRINT